MSCVSEKNKHSKIVNRYTEMDPLGCQVGNHTCTSFNTCCALYFYRWQDAQSDRDSFVFIKTHLLSYSGGQYSHKTTDCISREWSVWNECNQL